MKGTVVNGSGPLLIAFLRIDVTNDDKGAVRTLARRDQQSGGLINNVGQNVREACGSPLVTSLSDAKSRMACRSASR